MPRVKDIAYTAGITVGGIILYVPAAIGMLIAEMLKRPERGDDSWRFTLTDMDVSPAAISSARSDLWSKMNLSQYFRIVPGTTAIASENCAFTRPGLSLA